MRTTLIHRTTRRLSLTESGRASLERALRILADGEAVESEILEEAAIPRGLVRFACVGAFGVSTLAAVLPEFMETYPEVQLDMHIADDPVDLISEGFDLAIRLGPIPDSSLRISRLFSLRLPVVGSPAYLKKHGVPQHPSELSGHRTIVYTHILGADDWTFDHPQLGRCEVHVAGQVRCNNGLAAIPLLLAGQALALQPVPYIWQELQDGRLVEVLPEWRSQLMPVSVVTPPGKARPARVRVLIEFLRAHFSRAPWGDGVEL